MMEARVTQHVFQQVKDDSSSLLVLCSSQSFVTSRTQTTTATSKFSRKFTFDTELLQHKAYKNTLRSLMRRARSHSHPQAAGDSVTSRALNKQGAKASSHLVEILQADRIDRDRDIKVLIVGDETDQVLISFKFYSGDDLTRGRRLRFGDIIRRRLIESTRTVLHEGAERGSLDDQMHLEALNTSAIKPNCAPLPAEVIEAIRWGLAQADPKLRPNVSAE